MSKIDIDKFVASVYKHEVQKLPSGGQWSTTLWTLDEVLREQGLKYKAGEIVEIEPKLSNLEQNGKNSKPANFAKSCKDLQELTEFEENYLAILYSWCKGDDRVYNECKDGALKDAKRLLEMAYKQFKQDQMNQEFATFTRQEFNEAVDEEIKRRCKGIDATKMSDRYYHTLCEQWFKCDVAHDRELGYMKGVEDTIKKLKGE